MLGKTANALYWMFRYLERAENTARLIETGQRIALTRSSGSDEDWRSILQTAGAEAGYLTEHDTVERDAAINWMLRSKQNPSSVMSSMIAARQNARVARTGLTNEVWEATNSAYMLTQKQLARKVPDRDLPAILGQIRQNTALVRGATHGTMLRNDIYDFARIGTFLERADNTARILDVKYYVLLPSVSAVGSSLDNVQWDSILRSVSARGGFRMEYGSTPEPRDIAHFLILDGRMPRSLAFCLRKIRDNLGYLCNDYGDMAPKAAYDLVDRIDRDYLTLDIDGIFDFGLHEYIQKMLTLLVDLSGQIERDYRFYE